jgi:hypothetical protein
MELGQPITSEELTKATNTNERLIRVGISKGKIFLLMLDN